MILRREGGAGVHVSAESRLGGGAQKGHRLQGEGEVVHCPLEDWRWGERKALLHCLYGPKWDYLGASAVLRGVL